MRTFNGLLCGLCLFFSIGLINAQSEYAIAYQNEYIELSENIHDFKWRDLDRSDRIKGGYYMWMQFFETPVQQVQDKLKANGIELQAFINNSTYLAFVPSSTAPSQLAGYGVRAIHPVPPAYKLSANLRDGNIGDWALKGDQLHVTLLHHDKVTTDYVLNELLEMDIVLEQEVKSMNSLDLLIPNDCLDELAALSFIKYVAVIDAPAIKEDEDARGLHRSANLDTRTPGDRNYDGSGIGVMVRDDGGIGPHIDFHGRIDNSGASPSYGEHGDGVAGILTGAGNLNPGNRGMAAGADLYVVDYTADFTAAATFSLIENGQVQITNSSYGNGCNGGYTDRAALVDQQTNDFPSLLHVFSAGNSGTVNCEYGAGPGWGNITGGHKQGKNVIATANSFSDGDLAGSSSKGPATDGRIKPDITANGQNQISTDPGNGYSAFGGTSGASPGVAGVSAQLYQAYQELNNGNLPESALIKATLLNTANDYGNPGPDFNFGWGMLNGLRAVKLIEDNRFFQDKVSQGESNNHLITIPEGTVEVRFMVYWRDPAAFPGATTALVNDLDMKVLNTNQDTLLPFVLDPTPNPVNLNQDATNGEDHLNNMEQVVIDYPAAGDYTININGFDVPQGPQDYYIVYEVITDNITLTYPNTRVKLVSNTTVFIHWDAVNVEEGFNVEYSSDNGDSWNSIGFAPAGSHLETWTVPSGFSGEALVRVTSGSYSDVSDTTFSYGRRVSGLEITAACPTTMSFTWDAFDGADMYDLYILGEKYMEVVGSTSETTITVNTPELGTDVWYAVAARNTTTGAETRRTNAVRYNDGLLNCPLAIDLTVVDFLSSSSDFSAICNPLADSLMVVRLYNNGMQDEFNFPVSYQIGGQDPVVQMFTDTLSPGEGVDFTFPEPISFPTTGAYDITVNVNTVGDEFVGNNDFEIALFITNLEASPFEESFELTGFPSEIWQIVNEDNATTWEEVNVIGSDGNPTTAGYIDNFSYEAREERDIVKTALYTVSESAYLTFDLAKAQYGNNFRDAFQVEISTDCGDSYEVIYFKDGFDLATVPNYITANWSPDGPNDWRTDSIDVSAYAGQEVTFQFVNINGYGNGTFLDNVNLTEEVVVVINVDLEVAELLSTSDDFASVCNNDGDNLVSVNLTNNGVQDQSDFEVSYQLNNQPVVTEQFQGVLAAGETVEFTFTEPLTIDEDGEYELNITVNADGDQVTNNDGLSSTFSLFVDLADTPFEEQFEDTGFPSANWRINNPDDAQGWEEITVIGSDGAGTTAGYVNNFSYDTDGERDIVQTQVYTIIDSAYLYFDLAKAQASIINSDAFLVEVSTDCGDSFEVIYTKSGLELSTVSDFETANWTPSSEEDWRREYVDLQNYVGQNVLFQFVNINGNGNGTFLDNVNVMQGLDSISSNRELLTLEGVEIFPNPTDAYLNVRLPQSITGMVSLELFNNVGQLVNKQQEVLSGSQLSLDVTAQPAGVYYLRIRSGQKQSMKKVVIE